MYLKSKVLYLHVDSPLHVGAGSGLGAIDLPIQRERSTGYPLVHASGLKGALRDATEGEDPKLIEAVFGPDPGAVDVDAHAGAFSPGDARVLLFPVRSLKGVFAWTTSYNVLQRWAREMKDIYGTNLIPENFRGPAADANTQNCFASSKDIVTNNDKVVLEEFVFQHQNNDFVGQIAGTMADKVFTGNLDPYWSNLLRKNLVVLPEDSFRDFVNYATEVVTRTRLDPESKTVVKKALWTEERLPVDTVLYSPVRSTRIRMNREDIPEEFQGTPDEQAEKVLEWISSMVGDRIQMGGDQTIGHGLVNLKWEG